MAALSLTMTVPIHISAEIVRGRIVQIVQLSIPVKGVMLRTALNVVLKCSALQLDVT